MPEALTAHLVSLSNDIVPDLTTSGAAGPGTGYAAEEAVTHTVVARRAARISAVRHRACGVGRHVTALPCMHACRATTSQDLVVMPYL